MPSDSSQPALIAVSKLSVCVAVLSTEMTVTKLSPYEVVLSTETTVAKLSAYVVGSSSHAVGVPQQLTAFQFI